MKPKILHREAMDFSFKARVAFEQRNYSASFDYYSNAAELESKVAEFYIDKPDLEPTRSVIIRSAAFLNLKAGLIEEAKKFIFFGLLNIKDLMIKEQLNNALELAVSLSNMNPETASKEYNYINLLRQRSIYYILEPSSQIYGNSVSLETISFFIEGYLKSLKAYALSKFKKVLEIDDLVAKEIDKFINPLLTSSAYGSFKFSIGNDFLYRDGDKKEIIDLKANIVPTFHNEIFINPLTDSDITSIKSNYTDQEVNEIFRPLAKIKAYNNPYKVGYYDFENFNKKFAGHIINEQKQKLLTIKPVTQEDIGELESLIVHKRSFQGGKVHKKTIYKEELKSLEFDITTKNIEPENKSMIILNEDIILNINFSSDFGFTCTFSDLGIEFTDIEYSKSVKGFYGCFYEKMVNLNRNNDKNESEIREWKVIKKLVSDPDALK